MPRTRRPKPLYQRGDYALHERAGRNLEIVWYDRDRRRERSVSAATADIEAGKVALDKHYLRATGGEYVAPVRTASPLVANVMADYLLALDDDKASKNAIGHRLAHVSNYISTLKSADILCSEIDERWIAKFRTWLTKQPVTGNGWKNKSDRVRSPATIENSVIQLAAAMNWASQPPAFEPIPLKEVTRSPSYRADIPMLAAMFRYAMKPRRQNLLAFLRLSAATWARPDAVLDAATTSERGQWHSQARVFNLNPVGRRQTKKRRAMVPVPECVGAWLDTINGPVCPKEVSKATWRRMQEDLGIPFAGQGGMKLVRRSVATIARKKIGEANWIQGQMMLGHVPMTVSDIYAIPDPANLGLALAATQAIIDEIEALAPGAFYRNLTAHGDNVVAIGSGKNG